MDVMRMWEAILHRVYLLLVGVAIVASLAYLWAGHQPKEFQALAKIVVVPHLGVAAKPGEYQTMVMIAQQYASAPLPSSFVPTLHGQVQSRSEDQIQTELTIAAVANQPIVEVTGKDSNAAVATQLTSDAAYALANAFTEEAVAANSNYAQSVAQLQSQLNSLAAQIATTNTQIQQKGASSKLSAQLASLKTKYQDTNNQLSQAQAVWTAHPLVYFSMAQDATAAQVAGYSDPMIAAFGAVVGLFVGVGFALLIDLLDSTVRTSEDTKRLANLETIATVGVPSGSDEQLSAMKPDQYASVAMAYENLAGNIQFLDATHKLRTLLVKQATVVPNGEFVGINLAVALAQMRFSTLLIDANWRQPTVQARFALNQSGVGFFTTLLRTREDESTAFEAIVYSPVSGLHLLPTGPIPPNPDDLLHISVLGKLWTQLSSQYQYIVVLGPQVPDSIGESQLAESVDGTLVVARAGATRRAELVTATENLRQLQCYIVGAVLATAEKRTDSEGPGSRRKPTAGSSIADRPPSAKQVPEIYRPAKMPANGQPTRGGSHS